MKALNPFVWPLIWKFYAGLENLQTPQKIWRSYLNLDLLLHGRKVSIIHFTFANLVVGREHLGQVLGAQTSIGLRGYDISYYPINHPNVYNAAFWDRIHSIQTNSDDLYDWALKWGCPPAIPVTKITAAVNDHFIMDAKELIVREDLQTECRLVFVGRLHWKKGLDTLMRLMIHERDNHLTLDIVGDGYELEKLKFLIHSNQLSDQITLHGRQPQHELLKIIDQADMLVAPSIQEGCSNVVLEAQARGKYCVVSDAEGMHEVVENEVTGRVCSKFELKEYLDAINEYRNLEVSVRRKIAKYSVQRIRDRFTRSRQIEEWVTYFEQLNDGRSE